MPRSHRPQEIRCFPQAEDTADHQSTTNLFQRGFEIFPGHVKKRVAGPHRIQSSRLVIQISNIRPSEPYIWIPPCSHLNHAAGQEAEFRSHELVDSFPLGRVTGDVVRLVTLAMGSLNHGQFGGSTADEGLCCWNHKACPEVVLRMVDSEPHL